MNLSTMFLILALLVAIWWLIRKRNAGDSEQQRSAAVRPKSANTQFHAVSIRLSGESCQAAKAMSGRRFLATAAPKLPLPECDVLDCNCRFAHHDDRRSNKDRRSPFGPGGLAGSTGTFAAEQRSGTDRRRNKD
jgi:hypothetical protein